MTKDSGTLNSGKTGTARVCFCGTEAAGRPLLEHAGAIQRSDRRNAEDSRPAQAPNAWLPARLRAPTWRSVCEGASSHSANTPGAPDADCWTFPLPHSGTPRCTLTSVSPRSSDGSLERAPAESRGPGGSYPSRLLFKGPLSRVVCGPWLGKAIPHVYHSPF